MIFLFLAYLVSTQQNFTFGSTNSFCKVQETMLITRIIDTYPSLYNISVTLNSNDEYVIILADYPTKVILGNNDIVQDRDFRKIRKLYKIKDN